MPINPIIYIIAGGMLLMHLAKKATASPSSDIQKAGNPIGGSALFTGGTNNAAGNAFTVPASSNTSDSLNYVNNAMSTVHAGYDYQIGLGNPNPVIDGAYIPQPIASKPIMTQTGMTDTQKPSWFGSNLNNPQASVMSAGMNGYNPTTGQPYK